MVKDRGPVIRLQGGPGDKWEYNEEDLLDCIRAEQRMGRTVDHPSGWALAYERPSSSSDHIWVWRQGRNCHPELLD